MNWVIGVGWIGVAGSESISVGSGRYMGRNLAGYTNHPERPERPTSPNKDTLKEILKKP
jgi:hypothetical protein